MFRLVKACNELENRDPPRELSSFEKYAADLKRISDRVTALDAAANENPWTRVHAELVSSGLWASLKPASRSVYVVLCTLSDRRKRVTIAGVERVAKLAGLSVPRTLFAYRELKEYGLIRRRRIARHGYRPYLTCLTGPAHWAGGARPT